MIRAIETHYNGYFFRSRLEARWAVFFDSLGVKYEYEREGYDLGAEGLYLPDFWLPQERLFIEIKPNAIDDLDKKRAKALSMMHPAPVWILQGVPGEHKTLLLLPCQGEGNGFLEIDDQYIGLCPICKLAATIGTEKDGTLWFYCWSMARFPHHGRIKKKGATPFLDVLQSCYNAARSARFEHGETPRVLRGKPR